MLFRSVIALVQERGDLQLVPPSTLKLDLRAPTEAPAPNPVKAAHLRATAGRRAGPPRRPAWWTARATSGEVTSGFTKADILKAAPDDPRAPNGVLARVTEVLDALR